MAYDDVQSSSVAPEGVQPGSCASADDAFQGVSALTLTVADMGRSVGFYRSLGLRLLYGGPDAAFTSFRLGRSFLNLQAGDPPPAPQGWGRAVIWVDDTDALYERLGAAGIATETAPRDAPWGERYFHVRDPDGHELSFAHPLEGS